METAWTIPSAFELALSPAGGTVLGLLLALLVMLWLWALVDCIRRPLDDFAAKLTPGQWDKLAWLGVIVVLTLLGARLYWAFVGLKGSPAPAVSEAGRRRLRQALDDSHGDQQGKGE